METNTLDNDEYNELIKVFEDYMKNKKMKMNIFLSKN